MIHLQYLNTADVQYSIDLPVYPSPVPVNQSIHAEVSSNRRRQKCERKRNHISAETKCDLNVEVFFLEKIVKKHLTENHNASNFSGLTKKQM